MRRRRSRQSSAICRQRASAQSGIADVRSHRIWVETERYPIADRAKPLRSPHPAQYDVMASLDLLRDVLVEHSLLNERVGLEFGFVPGCRFPIILTHPGRMDRLHADRLPSSTTTALPAAQHVCIPRSCSHVVRCIDPPPQETQNPTTRVLPTRPSCTLPFCLPACDNLSIRARKRDVWHTISATPPANTKWEHRDLTCCITKSLRTSFRHLHQCSLLKSAV